MESENPTIYYGDTSSAFGDITLGLMDNKLCWLGFAGENASYRKGSSLERLTAKYGHKNLYHAPDKITAFSTRYGLNCLETLLNISQSHQSSSPAHPICPVHIDQDASPFQQRVWRGLQDIPAGHRWSYKQLATHIGRPSAIRAVASAVGENPISLIIPCHRVTRSNGDIGHYGWGHERKKHILEFEKAALAHHA